MDQDSVKESYECPAVGQNNLAHPLPGDEVVITGMSGHFPESDNMNQFAENLYNKVDMVTDDDRRWKTNHPEIPQRTGKINNVSKFDASFFGIRYKQAHAMDPMCRIMLETAFEAVVDAGMNPKELRGSNTGVFVGVCFSESEKTWFYDKPVENGFGLTGCCRALIANRVSYWLGVHGPSYAVDTASSSSITCMEIAYRAIRDGTCDAALVGGCNLCLHSSTSLQFSRLGVLSSDGRCKSFDDNANGYARAEAIVMLLLQKSKDARRIYATVVHTKINCDGYKIEGITHPSSRGQISLLEDFYRECGVDISAVDYIEAHATGSVVGDKEELRTIDTTFCKQRTTPLLIGSVSSNMGHSEPASGLCSIAKVIISMESGYIAPNINLKEFCKDTESFVSGRLSIVTEKTRWNGDLIGINSFGFGGTNGHVLLRSHKKEKIGNNHLADNIPRIVFLSGRTAEAVRRIINEIESNKLDAEFMGLLHEIFKYDIPGHIYRGYIVKTEEKTVSTECLYYAGGERRPTWIVFSGMGSQWAGMGTELLKIPIFAAAIEKCHKVLYPKGINIVDVITSSNEETLDDIIHSSVGICAVQIGLLDVLSTLGIVPDKIIGHSLGEIACAYADGCFTLEQAILSAYFRGLASKEMLVIKGAMAAVGIGYLQIQKQCPSAIDVACHNSFNSCTISGPEKDIKNFVVQLQANGVFGKEVNTSSIAYHSRYIKAVGPKLLTYLKELIPKPKLRSEKWMSTSVPESKWNEDASKYSSAEYHTNNMLSSVLFEETSKHIPNNAVVIEIAPHGLLQAILRRSLHKEVVNISLTQKGHKDNAEFLLTMLGKLYQYGYNPHIQNLFPKVNYPVSRGTPMISPLIKWEHSEDWFVTSDQIQEKMKSGEVILEFNPADNDREFVRDHVIDGQNLFPATGYIQIVWETFAMMQGKMYSEMSVILENVKFIQVTTVPTEGVIEFTVTINKGTGVFEISERGAAICTGRIFVPEDINTEMIELSYPIKQEERERLPLTQRDIYKELRFRGYNYRGLFLSLAECNNLATTARVRWHNNWVTFMDSLLQLRVLHEDTRALLVPTSIQRILCDIRRHGEVLNKITDKDDGVTVHVCKEFDSIRAGGIEIRGVITSPIVQKRFLGEPVLEKHVFMPNKLENQNLEEIVHIFVHLGIENLDFVKAKVVELIDEETITDGQPLSPIVNKVLCSIPLIQPEILIISKNPLKIDCGIRVANNKLSEENNCVLIIGTNFFARTKIFQTALDALKPGGFVISRESLKTNIANLNVPNSKILLEYSTKSEKLFLLSKTVSGLKSPSVVNVSARQETSTWLPELQRLLKTNSHVILYAENDPLSGILGLVNSIRKEPGGGSVKCFFIVDNNAPVFDIHCGFYKEQIDKNLAINVYKDGKWGTYRHLLIDDNTEVMTEHAYVNLSVRGDLSSLRWLQGPLTSMSTTETNHKLINVYYSTLNFFDIMVARGTQAPEKIPKGRLNQDCNLGIEFSGRDMDGHRVMGMTPCKALATMVSADLNYIWKIPDSWSLEDAATVPVAYGIAYKSLVMTGKMQRGQTVLIHSGSDGVGQAALHLALHYECKVFTTVDTLEKREFIKKRYPQITDNQIGNSCSTSFEQLIMTETDGRGVDLVLNSLTEDKLQSSFRCLAQKGKFLETGKYDLFSNNTVGMRMFLKEVSFHSVSTGSFYDAPVETRKELHRVIEEGIKCGIVKPLRRHVFQKGEIESAYQFMASGKHLGKILISVREEEKEKSIKSPLKLFPAVPSLMCFPDKTYIIVGGLGELGLELADRLVLKGARKLVLTSRKGVSNGYQALRIRLWESYGVQVFISTVNITTQQGVQELLMKASKMAPVESIYNLAAVLRDASIENASIENQTRENFKSVFEHKVMATRNLDTASQKLCPELKHFVTFSSVFYGHGKSQANYTMASSVMERICEQRRQQGLPGLTIQLGLVADTQEDDAEMDVEGTLLQQFSNCLNTLLDVLVAQEESVLSITVATRKQSLRNNPQNVVDFVRQITGIQDLKAVNSHSTLTELGLDTKMCVEVKEQLERDFELLLSSFDVRSLTFTRLMELDVLRQIQNKEEGTDDFSITGKINSLFKTIGNESTAFDSVIKYKKAVEHNIINSQVFLIPGIESCDSIFNNFMGKLNSQAFCLQIPPDSDCESIQGMAELCLQSMKNVSTRLKDFVLIGYSFGTLIALEMAMLLESEGYRGHIIIIDGSPSTMLDLLNKNFLIKNEGICPVRMLDLVSSYTKCDFSSLKPVIENEPTWEKKLQVFVENCPHNLPYSASYLQVMISSFKMKLNAIVNYTPSQKKLISPIRLIRPKSTSKEEKNLRDYNLSVFSNNEVEVFFVGGNHFTILENVKCVNIINNLTKNERTLFEESLSKVDLGVDNNDVNFL